MCDLPVHCLLQLPSFVTVCCLAVSVAVTTWPYTLLATVLCAFVTFTMVKVLSSFPIGIVDYYIRSAKIFDAAVQQIFSAIHFGEITSFGFALLKNFFFINMIFICCFN